MNDTVDLARPASRAGGAEFDLAHVLAGLLAKGAAVRLCQTCLNRCDIRHGDISAGAEVAGMKDFVDWIKTSGRTLSF